MFKTYLLKYAFVACLLFLDCIAMSANDSAADSDSLKHYYTPSVTVSTNRVVKNVSGVPFSELKKDDIENSYIFQDVPNLISNSPSAVFYSQNGNSVGYSNLSIRGFEQRRISVMINGIPQNDPEDHNVYWIDVPDITSNLENIQITRGAGISNYGSAAIGGSINMSTSNFVNTRGVRIFSGVNWQEYGTSGSELFQPTVNKEAIEISSGITDNYAFYARLSRIDSKGYRDRAQVNMNSYFLSAVRYDKNLTTQINVFGGPVYDGLAYTGLPKDSALNIKSRRANPTSWAYQSDGKTVDYYELRKKQEIEGFSQPHFEILNDWFINDNLTLKSSVFYYQGKGFYDFDGGWADKTLTGLLSNDYTIGTNDTLRNSIIKATVNNYHGGWIPRLVWKVDKSEFTAGLEMRWHRSQHYGQIAQAERLPENYDLDYKFYTNDGIRDIYSAFLRERYEVNDKLALSCEGQLISNRYGITNETIGGQKIYYYDKNGNIAGNGGELFNVHYLFFNPRLGANYKVDDKTTVYAMAAYTHREPRMRNLYAADDLFWGGAVPLFKSVTNPATGKTYYDFASPLVKPEKMLDLELGANWANSIFSFDVNTYYMNYKDEFVKTGATDIYGDAIDENVPGTLHYGLELQGTANVFNNQYGKLQIGFNANFSSNTIRNFHVTLDNGKELSLKDNNISGFPNSVANLMIKYQIANLYLGLTGKFVGAFRSDFWDNMRQDNAEVIHYLKNLGGYYYDNTVDSYAIANLDLSYTFDNILSMQKIKLQLQINNLFNKIYAAGAEGQEFFPAAERNIFVGFELTY